MFLHFVVGLDMKMNYVVSRACCHTNTQVFDLRRKSVVAKGTVNLILEIPTFHNSKEFNHFTNHQPPVKSLCFLIVIYDLIT